MIEITKNDIESLKDRDRVRLINSLAGIKPVNLIGTKSLSNVSNLSIVSSVVHLGANPALLGFIVRPDVVPRDTLDNLRENPYLTINHVHEAIVEQAHQTSARYDKNTSEFDECHLTEQFIGDHNAPFVTESKIKIAAKFLREIKIEENGTHFIICEITGIHLPKECLSDDYSINLDQAKSIGVSGLDTYFDLSILGQLSYAKPNQILKWIQKE